MAPKKTTPAGRPPPPHLRRRVTALQRRLYEAAGDKADALLVTNATDIHYLTGFSGEDSWALVPLSPRARKVYLLSDPRFDEQIAREAPHVERVIRRNEGMVEALAVLARREKISSIGLQPAHVSLALRKKMVTQFRARQLPLLKDRLPGQRAIKDEREVEAINKALQVQQQAFTETVTFIKPGMTEAEVAAYLEYRMRALGAEGASFPTIVAADANSSLPHATPGQKQLSKNSTLLIDWGARVDGYCGDMTRVVALGEMSSKLREIYQIVLDAQVTAIDAARPGISLRELDGVARDIIAKAGYGDQFGHSLGHGLGLEVHEQPSLSQRSAKEAVLEVGQVVTIEPGIYVPGLGGVRIEDDVLVTPKGSRVLSNLPKTLESAIIRG